MGMEAEEKHKPWHDRAARHQNWASGHARAHIEGAETADRLSAELLRNLSASGVSGNTSRALWSAAEDIEAGRHYPEAE